MNIVSNMKKKHCILRKNHLIFLVVVLAVACNNDPLTIRGPAFHGKPGVYIANEGNITFGNASLSFYDPESGKASNNIFLVANGIPLGDVANSLSFYGNKGYVVVNNSAKIVGFDPEDAALRGTIGGFESPRRMLVLNDVKAYVSDLYARRIFIVNPKDTTITGSIDISVPGTGFAQHNAEQMLLAGDRVFAACWSYDNTILVIDQVADRVTDSVKVTKQPNSMVTDRQGRLWVLSDGGYAGSAYGQDTAALTCIDPASLRVTRKLVFPSPDASPIDLAVNGTGDTLYYLDRDLYSLPVDSKSLPGRPYIAAGGRQFYSLGIDPATSEIYLGDAIDYQQNGLVYRYNGTAPVDSFRAGINPGAFYFTGQ